MFAQANANITGMVQDKFRGIWYAVGPDNHWYRMRRVSQPKKGETGGFDRFEHAALANPNDFGSLYKAMAFNEDLATQQAKLDSLLKKITPEQLPQVKGKSLGEVLKGFPLLGSSEENKRLLSTLQGKKISDVHHL